MAKQKPKKLVDADYHAVYAFLYAQWYDRLYNMLLTSITWMGENTLFSSYSIPERWLCNNGMCVAFQDDAMGFLMLPCTAASSLDVYGYPSSYQAYGMNGYIRDGLIHGENAVVIFNNPQQLPETKILDNYAYRLTEIQITNQCNLNANKTPLGVFVPEELKLSAENAYQQFTLGKPVILGGNNLSTIIPHAINTGANFLVPELSLELRTVWAEWLTYIGVPAMDLNKSERLLKDEIAQAMGGAIACRSARMKTRRAAAQMIEDVLGVEMYPVFSSDIEPVPQFLLQNGTDTGADQKPQEEYSDQETSADTENAEGNK